MDSTISTTLSRTPNHQPRCACRAFTLFEMMVGGSLGGFIMTAVLTSFLFIGRSGANIQNYTEMESQTRGALEFFAQDVRQASAITWNTQHSCTLTVNSVPVVYQYDSGARVFSRLIAGNSRNLITSIRAGSFTFRAFNVSGTELPLSTGSERTVATSSTKLLQITLEATRHNSTTANVANATNATNTVLSARFILRNKLVTA